MKTTLDVFESSLQKLVEGIPQLLRANRPADFARKISLAMQSSMEYHANGNALIPSSFTLYIHPETHTRLLSPQDLIDSLIQAIQKAANEQGITFVDEPSIRFEMDAALARNDIRVSLNTQPEHLSMTAAVDISTPTLAESPPLPQDAYLIVEGRDTFPLLLPVVNIGRRDDNHLVIEDLRVSRNHAQLRAVKGKYIIFDLNSTGGIFVNGQRISQATLSPGDVISLAGFTMIFGESSTPSSDDTDRMPKL